MIRTVTFFSPFDQVIGFTLDVKQSHKYVYDWFTTINSHQFQIYLERINLNYRGKVHVLIFCQLFPLLMKTDAAILEVNMTNHSR